MTIIFPVIIALVLLTVGNSVFKRYNMGLARNSLGQQMRRYIIGAVQAVLPMALGLDGVWISIVVAEIMAVVFSAIFLIAKRKKYHY